MKATRPLRLLPELPSATKRSASGPEARWVERAVEGDDVAVRKLLRAVAPAVERTIAGVLGPHDPEFDDVVQDSLVALVRALPAYRGQAPIRSFAIGIAVRLAITSVRRRRRRPPPVELFERPDAASGSMAASIARRQLLELLRLALQDLPTEQAETVHLRWVLGHSLEEVAASTSVGINTARSRLRLARAVLHKRMLRDPRWTELLQLATEDP